MIFEAMSFSDLFRFSEPKRVVRSKTVKGPPLDIKAFKDSIFYTFNFKSNPSTTGLRHHGYIKFQKPGRDMPLSQVKCLVDCTCFSGDTLVLMGDGTYRPIKDIRVGDEVFTHKGRKRAVLRNASRPLKSSEKVYEVEVEGFQLPLKVTDSHPFYTLRGNEWKWVEVKDFMDREWFLAPCIENRQTYSQDEGQLKGLKGRTLIEFDQPVWDLTVEEDHSFIAHGVAVHNCQDYRYRWGWANKQRGASKVGPGSMNQALNRAPHITNPTGRPGLCKHILALKEFIQGTMASFPANADKSSDDVLNKLVTYANDRWTNLPQHMAKAKERDATFAARRALQRAGRDLEQAKAAWGVPTPGENEVPMPPELPAEMDVPVPTPIPEKPRRGSVKPSKRVDRSSESLMKHNTSLIDVKVLKRIIEDEETAVQTTPPTKGESDGDDALGYLRKIEAGIQSMNQGLADLSDRLGSDLEGEGEGEDGEGLDGEDKIPGEADADAAKIQGPDFTDEVPEMPVNLK